MSAEHPVSGTDRVAAVLFDMDGLLVETESSWYAVECEVMARLGGPWGRAHQRALVGGALPNAAGYMVELAGSDVAPATVLDWLVDAMVERLGRQAPAWMPGAEQLLGAVRAAGLTTALVSASYRRIVDSVLAMVGPERFDVTVAGDEVARTKPDPEPYLRAAAALGVPPAACIVLEDSANGARAGLAAGCLTVAVPSIAPVPPLPGLLFLDTLQGRSVAELVGFVGSRSGASWNSISRS